LKIVAILGSPHINGNGAFALNSILEGAKENGLEFIKYELCKLNIKNCLGCRKCIENGGVCVIKDDFTEIFEQIKTANTVIISSPIYINQVNGYTKTFLDRCYPLTDKNHKPRFGKRNVIMLCTYGVPIPFIFSRYIKRTGKSLKAMGLINNRNIIIHGCTTINKVKNTANLQAKLETIGKKL
jgi:multimeric flavodoxin WrbA